MWLQKLPLPAGRDGGLSCRNGASVSRGRDSLVGRQLLCILRRDEYGAGQGTCTLRRRSFVPSATGSPSSKRRLAGDGGASGVL